MSLAERVLRVISILIICIILVSYITYDKTTVYINGYATDIRILYKNEHDIMVPFDKMLLYFESDIFQDNGRIKNVLSWQ